MIYDVIPIVLLCCFRSWLVITEVIRYEVNKPLCGQFVVPVLLVTVGSGVVIYEAMTSHCQRSVVQVLIVKVDKKWLPMK